MRVMIAVVAFMVVSVLSIAVVGSSETPGNGKQIEASVHDAAPK